MNRNLLRLGLSCLLLALVLALVACSGSQGGSSGGTNSGKTPGSTTPGGATITEQGFAFSPSKLAVNVGDTVTFVNQDSATHNVNIDGKDLGDQAQGQSVTWTPKKAGSYPYKCSIHPSMTGEITVK